MGQSLCHSLFLDLQTKCGENDTSAVGDVAVVSTGATPSRKVPSYYQGEIPWVKTREVDGGWILNTEEKIAEKAIKESNCKVFPERTVLVAMYGQG